MDTGIFKRHKLGFWLWIILPLMLTVGLNLGARAYCRHIEMTVRRKQALAQFLPRLDEALALSRARISKFKVISGTASEARAALNTRISAISTECGLLIDSINIKSQSTTGPVQGLEADIEGEGQLLPIMKFLDKLQSPESLIALVESRLILSKAYPVPTYHWTFRFKTGFVANHTEVEP